MSLPDELRQKLIRRASRALLREIEDRPMDVDEIIRSVEEKSKVITQWEKDWCEKHGKENG